MRPHTPYVCPKEKVDLYPVANMVLPSNFASRPKAPPGVPGAVRPNNADLFQREVMTPQRAKTALSHYFGCVSHIDDQIGRLPGRLDQLQLRSNTIVVFMSDHGYMLGERGRWSKHGSLFDLGVGVPLVIDAPGTAGRGRGSQRIVEAVDLFPTLAQLAGLPVPAFLQGGSLVPLLQNPDAAWDRPAYSQTSIGAHGEPSGRTVRTADWRYTERTGGRDGIELYDETHDPQELRNLAKDLRYREIAAMMKAKLRAGPF